MDQGDAPRSARRLPLAIIFRAFGAPQPTHTDKESCVGFHGWFQSGHVRRAAVSSVPGKTITPANASVSFFNLVRQNNGAQEINYGNDGESHEDYARHKTTPDESVDHVFGFYIHRAPWTTARGLLKHVTAIATSLCGHCRCFHCGCMSRNITLLDQD